MIVGLRNFNPYLIKSTAETKTQAQVGTYRLFHDFVPVWFQC